MPEAPKKATDIVVRPTSVSLLTHYTITTLLIEFKRGFGFYWLPKVYRISRLVRTMLSNKLPKKSIDGKFRG